MLSETLLLFVLLRSRTCARAASYPTSARLTALLGTQRPIETMPLQDIIMKMSCHLCVQLANAFCCRTRRCCGRMFLGWPLRNQINSADFALRTSIAACERSYSYVGMSSGGHP